MKCWRLEPCGEETADVCACVCTGMSACVCMFDTCVAEGESSSRVAGWSCVRESGGIQLDQLDYLDSRVTVAVCSHKACLQHCCF